MKTVADGSGRNQAHPLAGDERACRHCGKSLAGKRRNARYCDSTCRAEATHVRHGRRAPLDKTLRSAASGHRRASRDGRGVRIYVTPEETAGWVEGIVLGSVRDKLDAAADRLGVA